MGFRGREILVEKGEADRSADLAGKIAEVYFAAPDSPDCVR